jgi:hypothetical protein
MRRKSNLARLVPCFAAALAAWAAPGGAQIADTRAPQPLFASDQPIALRVDLPFAAVTRGATRGATPEYQPARLSYTAPSGETIATDLRVRERGKSRRVACSFPPLLLNFRPNTLGGTVFEGQSRLKLVTHCEPREANAQFVFLEYLAYRVLNLVTDTSLRVRPVTVTYFDTDRGREIARGPGILLEDEASFAARSGLTPIEDQRVERARYDAAALGLVETFEYFIGNTDWSAFAGPPGSKCCHNVVPLARADGVLLPIIYDFDASGIVDPPYALPDQRLRIGSVRNRLYRGPCRDLAALRATFVPFEAKRAEIRALYEQHAQLAAKSRDKALGYIDDFYAVLADPKNIERAFRSSCAG